MTRSYLTVTAVTAGAAAVLWALSAAGWVLVGASATALAAALLVGLALAAFHQVSHRHRSWGASFVAYTATVAGLAGFALQMLASSDAVPLLVAAALAVAGWAYRNPTFRPPATPATR